MARWFARHAVIADALIAAAAFGGLLLDVADAGLQGPQRMAAIALSAAMAGSLAWRRRLPLASYVVGTAALAAQALFVYTGPLYPYVNLLGIYSAALYSPRRRGRLALPVGLAGVVAFFTTYDTAAVMLPLLIALVWTGAWASGYAVARRREQTQAQQTAALADAASEERRRIARELHDLVGHTVNVMVVQAGAARSVLERDPARAKEALLTLERIGRGALDELDRVLGVLRSDEPAADVAWEPQTQLADIEALADRVAAGGITVSTTVEGTPSPAVPRSLEVSAYRIVQEALTNTLKHAQAHSAWVVVRHRPDAVEIEVRDDGTAGLVAADGRPAPPNGAGTSPASAVGPDGRPDAGGRTGRGLTGMAERVAVFGGQLEHGADAAGYRVRAVLPLDAAPRPAGGAPARS